jgi:taurine dioxygenase
MHELLLHPVGIQLTDLSLGHLSEVAVLGLEELLGQHGLIVLPGQHIDDVGFVEFLKRFGPLTFTAGEIAVRGFADLNVVSNVGRTSLPRSTFHSDTSYVRRPPAYTALRAVHVPRRGGATVFTNQYQAFETLPAAVRTRLQGRTIRHVMTGLELAAGEETAADHPVFRRHPISGRTALYLSTPARCAAISGLGTSEAQRMIRFLHAHSTSSDNTYRHIWSAGDIVMWDNGCVLHRADHANVVGDRVMHRGMVADYRGNPTATDRCSW